MAFQWDLLQPCTEGVQELKTRTKEGFRFKYRGKRGGTWDQGPMAMGKSGAQVGARDQRNQWGNRGRTLQLTGTNGDQGRTF